jgi:hypothetical protein
MTGMASVLAAEPATVIIPATLVDGTGQPLGDVHLTIVEELPPDGGIAAFAVTTAADGTFAMSLYAWGTADAPATVTVKTDPDEELTVEAGSCSRTWGVAVADSRELALAETPPDGFEISATTTLLGEVCGTTGTPGSGGSNAGHGGAGGIAQITPPGLTTRRVPGGERRAPGARRAPGERQTLTTTAGGPRVGPNRPFSRPEVRVAHILTSKRGSEGRWPDGTSTRRSSSAPRRPNARRMRTASLDGHPARLGRTFGRRSVHPLGRTSSEGRLERHKAHRLRNRWPTGLSREEAQDDGPLRVVRVRVEERDRLPRPEGHGPADDRYGDRRSGEERQDVVGAVTGRPVPVAPAFVARQEPIERLERVVVGAGTELQDHDAGGRVRHEHGEQPVSSPTPLGEEPPAGVREVGEAAIGSGPDRQPDGLHRYGKMLRSASRIRPRPPIAGADS